MNIVEVKLCYSKIFMNQNKMKVKRKKLNGLFKMMEFLKSNFSLNIKIQ